MTECYFMFAPTSDDKVRSVFPLNEKNKALAICKMSNGLYVIRRGKWNSGIFPKYSETCDV